MGRARPPFSGCIHGLLRVTRILGLSRATVYRSCVDTLEDTPPRRPRPIGACSDANLANHIRREIDASEFRGEDYRKIWSRLRFSGLRASLRRVRRVMDEHGLPAPPRAVSTAAKTHDGMIATDHVNEMWGLDMTQTISPHEGKTYVFVAVEHANSEVVGVHAAKSANRFEALEPVRQGVKRCFAPIAPKVASGLQLRHDNGTNYVSETF